MANLLLDERPVKEVGALLRALGISADEFDFEIKVEREVPRAKASGAYYTETERLDINIHVTRKNHGVIR